jgi:hypothetical protein
MPDATHPPLDDTEFHRFHMMTPEQYAALPADQKRAYEQTAAYHFDRRISDGDPSTFVTGDGESMADVLKRRRAKGG